MAYSSTAPAADGSQKYLFRLADGQRIESVYMPMGDRVSICLSSQAGCAVGCTFCVTGFFGAGRNLTPSEIVGQFFVIQRQHVTVNFVLPASARALHDMERLPGVLHAVRRVFAQPAFVAAAVDAVRLTDPTTVLELTVEGLLLATTEVLRTCTGSKVSERTRRCWRGGCSTSSDPAPSRQWLCWGGAAESAKSLNAARALGP